MTPPRRNVCLRAGKGTIYEIRKPGIPLETPFPAQFDGWGVGFERASPGLWETESDFQGSVQWNQGQLTKFAGLLAAPPSVDGYDVVAEALSDRKAG